MIIALLCIISYSNLYSISETDLQWHLYNDKMMVKISKTDAKIDEISMDNHVIFSGPIKSRLSKNSTNKSRNIKKIKVNKTSKEYATLIFDIDYSNMKVEYKYTIDALSLRFDVNVISLNKFLSEISIDFLIPFTNEMEQVFVPDGKSPVKLSNLLTMQYQYRKNIMLPFLSFYSYEHDLGISIITPLEIPKPALAFSLDRNGTTISFSRLRCSKTFNSHAAIYVVPHEGDWRPGLAFMVNKYPDFFNPAEDAIYDSEGWYFLADAYDTKDKIQKAKDRNVQWVELHGHFPFYGLYAPFSDKWGVVIDSDVIRYKDWSHGAGKKVNNYQRMKTLIDTWHHDNVKTFLYFQCFECWYQYADMYYAHDIAKDKNLLPHPAWKLTRLMNPDPNSKWGKFVLKQCLRLLFKYPDIDGFFYDRMDYWNYDFASDDQVTMIGDKPVYMLGFAFEKLNATIFRILHEKGKSVWGNNPSSIEVCKYLDGIMAESHAYSLFRMQYLTVSRPLVFLAYDRTPVETENKLKNAILSGAFPSLTYGDSICVSLDAKYAPLFEKLKHRKWVLDPNPITLDNSYKYNLFRLMNGDLAIIIVSMDRTALEPAVTESNIALRINVPEANEFSEAQLYSVDFNDVLNLNIKHKEDYIDLMLPRHHSVSLIYLRRK